MPNLRGTPVLAVLVALLAFASPAQAEDILFETLYHSSLTPRSDGQAQLYTAERFVPVTQIDHLRDLFRPEEYPADLRPNLRTQTVLAILGQAHPGHLKSQVEITGVRTEPLGGTTRLVVTYRKVEPPERSVERTRNVMRTFGPGWRAPIHVVALPKTRYGKIAWVEAEARQQAPTRAKGWVYVDQGTNEIYLHDDDGSMFRVTNQGQVSRILRRLAPYRHPAATEAGQESNLYVVLEGKVSPGRYKISEIEAARVVFPKVKEVTGTLFEGSHGPVLHESESDFTVLAGNLEALFVPDDYGTELTLRVYPMSRFFAVVDAVKTRTNKPVVLTRGANPMVRDDDDTTSNGGPPHLIHGEEVWVLDRTQRERAVVETANGDQGLIKVGDLALSPPPVLIDEGGLIAYETTEGGWPLDPETGRPFPDHALPLGYRHLGGDVDSEGAIDALRKAQAQVKAKRSRARR